MMVLLESLELYPGDPQGLPKKPEPGDQVVQRGVQSVPGGILCLDPAATFRVLLWDSPSDSPEFLHRGFLHQIEIFEEIGT